MDKPKEGFYIPSAPERPEEFAPGLDKELQEMADALTEFKTKLTKNGSAMNGKKTHSNKN